MNNAGYVRAILTHRNLDSSVLKKVKGAWDAPYAIYLKLYRIIIVAPENIFLIEIEIRIAILINGN